MEASNTDYEELTKADLQTEAETRGLTIHQGATKADIIAALQESDEQLDDPQPDNTLPGEETETSTDIVSGRVPEDVPPADATTDGPQLQDVDVADIEPVVDEDAHFLLTGESWVKLGEYEGVPDWAVGMPAAVIDAPVSTMYSEDGHTELYQYTDPSALITVRERTQGATFSVPLDSCEAVSVSGGRGNVVNHP